MDTLFSVINKYYVIDTGKISVDEDNTQLEIKIYIDYQLLALRND